MSETRCKICGLPEDDHHPFVGEEMPDGCVCDPGTWGDEISAVCKAYVGDGFQNCETCEHDKKCHKESR